MMEDLVAMHAEFRQLYGHEESDSPQWMKWEELDMLSSVIKDIVIGKDGTELGSWMPLYRYFVLVFVLVAITRYCVSCILNLPLSTQAYFRCLHPMISLSIYLC